MESLDLIQIISGNSPAMAFGIICLVWMRSDRAAALEDAKQYAAAIAGMNAELLKALKENTEASVKLERRIHEQNNILQRILFYFEDQRASRGKGEA